MPNHNIRRCSKTLSMYKINVGCSLKWYSLNTSAMALFAHVHHLETTFCMYTIDVRCSLKLFRASTQVPVVLFVAYVHHLGFQSAL